MECWNMTDEEKNVSIYFKSSGENCIKSKLLLYRTRTMA